MQTVSEETVQATFLYLPAAQTVQAEHDPALEVVEYVPAEQLVHTVLAVAVQAELT